MHRVRLARLRLSGSESVATAARGCHSGRVERFVALSSNTRLWVQQVGDVMSSPLLLVMGANASGLAWPDALVHTLAEHHRVIRYDHRDTGPSTWNFDEHPYAVSELAERIMNHAGRHDNPAAHARAAVTGLNRAAELAGVRTPTLVIKAPEDPSIPHHMLRTSLDSFHLHGWSRCRAWATRSALRWWARSARRSSRTPTDSELYSIELGAPLALSRVWRSLLHL